MHLAHRLQRQLEGGWQEPAGWQGLLRGEEAINSVGGAGSASLPVVGGFEGAGGTGRAGVPSAASLGGAGMGGVGAVAGAAGPAGPSLLPFQSAVSVLRRSRMDAQHSVEFDKLVRMEVCSEQQGGGQADHLIC